MAHHGSAVGTSSGFLSRVSPTVAVIEVGAGNDYGHPNQKTLIDIQNIGADVFRTDLDGTIIVTTDGTTHTVTKSKDTAPVSTFTPLATIVTPKSTPTQVVQPAPG